MIEKMTLHHWAALIAASFFMTTSNVSVAADTKAACLASAKDELRSLEQAIKEANKAIPKELTGKQVPVGPCTLRAVRLGVTMGIRTTFENVVKAEDAAHCLALQKFYIEQNCSCLGKGKSFERNEANIDKNLEKVASIRAIEGRARKVGITNPAIRAFVRDAAELRDCIESGTLEQLNRIEKSLNAIVPTE